MILRRALVPVLLCSVACGSAPAPKTASPKPEPTLSPFPSAAPPKDPLAEPPPSGITQDLPFPTIQHRPLSNGLELRVITRRTYPLIEIRLVIASGQASDGEKPGLASVAGELLKAGGAGRWNSRELVERAESLGGSLNIYTDRDATRIALSVTSADLQPAFEILAAVVQSPRFAPDEFKKLKQEEVDRVKSAARGSAGWAASMLLYRELYELPTTVHPYSHYDALPHELNAITLQDCKAWHKLHVTAENSVLVLSGDVDPDAAEHAAAKAFAAWKGKKPAQPSFNVPEPPKQIEILIADRPGSAQSQIYVAGFGPERQSTEYPALMTTNQILGGGVASRLFVEVREKQSLAYSTGSYVEEPAHGPVPIVVSAGTQTAKTAEAVSALLEQVGRISREAPKQRELDAATRQLSDSFLFRTETAGNLADLTSRLVVLKLPDTYYDEYRKAVRSIDLDQVLTTGKRYFTPSGLVVVVAGDAAKIAEPLRKLAPVSVVDPEKDFAPK